MRQCPTDRYIKFTMSTYSKALTPTNANSLGTNELWWRVSLLVPGNGFCFADNTRPALSGKFDKV